MGVSNTIKRLINSRVGVSPPAGRLGRARVAIISIIDEEFDAAQSAFELNYQIPGTRYFSGAAQTSAIYDVVLTQATDRTNLPAMGDTILLMEDFRPQVIILLGVAGGLCDENLNGRDGLGLGDVVIADQVSYVEFLKLENGQPPKVRTYAIDHPSVSLRTNVGTPLKRTLSINELVTLSPPVARVFNIHIGQIVSGEKVMGDVDSPVQQDLLLPYDKALAVDMESIGVARAVCNGRSSFWYHPRYVVIRGISDLVVAEENNNMRAAWKPFAAHAAAVVAQQFVARLPTDAHAS